MVDYTIFQYTTHFERFGGYYDRKLSWVTLRKSKWINVNRSYEHKNIIWTLHLLNTHKVKYCGFSSYWGARLFLKGVWKYVLAREKDGFIVDNICSTPRSAHILEGLNNIQLYIRVSQLSNIKNWKDWTSRLGQCMGHRPPMQYKIMERYYYMWLLWC